MGRPSTPAEPLDLDTRMILNWAAARKTGKVNITDFYAEQKALDLEMSRNSLYKAMRGEPVSADIAREIEDTIAVRGWAKDYQAELDTNYKALSLTMFRSQMNRCRVCEAVCGCCGEPDSEQRRQAIIKRRYPDPLGVLRDHPDIEPMKDYI
jgi:hypothetical protein